MVAMAADPATGGYWLVAATWDLLLRRSLRREYREHPPRPARRRYGSGADGSGYRLVASDGGLFSFPPGLRGFAASFRLTVRRWNERVSTTGYWMVARDGGVFAFGGGLFRQ